MKVNEVDNELLEACIWGLDALLGFEGIILDEELLAQNKYYREVYKHMDGECACAITQLRKAIANARESNPTV